MLTLLLGPDAYSKKKYVENLAAKTGAQVAVFVQPAELPLGQLLGQDLFAQQTVFMLEGAVSQLNEKNVLPLIETKNQVFFLEEKVDKRSSFNKSLVNRKDVAVKEFSLPHGAEVNAYIKQRIAQLGGKISREAVETLAVAIGRDQAQETKFGGRVVGVKELFTLEQLENELAKLIAYSGKSEIQAADVTALVSENEEADVLEIVNAIAENNKQKTFQLLELFLRNETASDEKGKIIQLNALLSEQFRNVAMVQDFLTRRVPENEMADQTGWKQGRVFVMKKIASKFSSKKVLDLLTKLSFLDDELKTSQTPPRVLLDMITVQLLT